MDSVQAVDVALILYSRTTQKTKFSFSSLIEVKALPIGFLSLLLSFCYSGIIAFIAIYLKQKDIDNGPIYFYIAFAITMILSRPYIGKIIDKKNPNVLIYPSLILFAIGMISMAITQSMTMVIVSGVILGLSYGSIFPCFQTLTVQTSPKEKSGAAMATFFLFYDLGFGLGALILAKITALYDYSSMYFIISLIIFGMMVCYYLFRKYNLVTERTL